MLHLYDYFLECCRVFEIFCPKLHPNLVQVCPTLECATDSLISKLQASSYSFTYGLMILLIIL